MGHGMVVWERVRLKLIVGLGLGFRGYIYDVDRLSHTWTLGGPSLEWHNVVKTQSDREEDTAGAAVNQYGDSLIRTDIKY